VFNLSGSEIIVILLLALVVLGPEKLPEALRRAGRTYAELKKMGNSFQSEMRSVLDEPMKEMRDTADLLRKAVDVTVETATTDTRALAKPSAEPVPEVAAAEAELAAAAEPSAPPDDPGAEPIPEVAAADAELEEMATTDGTDPAPEAATNGPAMDAEPAAPTVDPEDELINRTLSGGS
jgi:sec-independent protein translocase protein TatB